MPRLGFTRRFEAKLRYSPVDAPQVSSMTCGASPSLRSPPLPPPLLRWFHPQLEAYLGCTVLREYGGPACGCNLHTPIRIMYYCGSLRPALTAFMQCELAPQARSLREEPWIGEVSQLEHVGLSTRRHSAISPVRSMGASRERIEDEANVVAAVSQRLRTGNCDRLQ